VSPLSDVQINGVALDPAATYRVTTNNSFADGGNSFASLRAAARTGRR
jgi:5'-nucleotidase